MKSIIAALLLFAGPAMAQVSQDEVISSRPDDYMVEFLSWCENNNVMGEDAQGNTVVRLNCSEQNQICRPGSIFRLNRTIYFATCQRP